jgi:hypothetical protein
MTPVYVLTQYLSRIASVDAILDDRRLIGSYTCARFWAKNAV